MKFATVLVALITFSAFDGLRTVQAREPLIFAAASLNQALDRILGQYQTTIRVSYASSGALARQIDRGAPADFFISANRKWIAWLLKKGRLVPSEINPLVGNQLVLARNRHSSHINGRMPTEIFASLRNGERIAAGDPAHVPLGQYTKSTLTRAGTWALIKNRLAPMQNARAAATLVERGAVPLGILYKTDALMSERLEMLFEFPAKAGTEIRYYMASVNAGKSKEIGRLKAYLFSAPAAKIWRAHGFTTGWEP